MILVCHVISQDHMIKVSCNRHCRSGEMMFLVVEGQDSICPGFDLSLLFISKVHGMP